MNLGMESYVLVFNPAFMGLCEVDVIFQQIIVITVEDEKYLSQTYI